MLSTFKHHFIATCLIFSAGFLYAQQWVNESPLNIPRYGAASVVLDGRIYVMGGATNLGQALNSVETFNTALGIWDTTTARFNIPRIYSSAAVLDGKIYLSGGLDPTGNIRDEVEVFDPATGQWTFIDDLEKERQGHIMVAINNSLAVFCGQGENGELEEKIEYYDPDDDEWERSSTELPYLRSLPFATVVNNRYYMFGGLAPFPISSSYSAGIDNGWNVDWLPLPDLSESRANGATIVSDQKIYMLGGITSNGNPSALVSYYDINADHYQDELSLPSPRAGLTGVLYEGNFYIIGGYDSDPTAPLTTVQRLAPTAIEDPPTPLPTAFELLKGFPNPFNGTVHFNLSLNQLSPDSRLFIYDITGRRIKTLHQGSLPNGVHRFTWHARDEQNQEVSSGVYLVVYQDGLKHHAIRVNYVK